LKFLYVKRGTEAIEDIGIIPRYGEVIIHDCWQSYLSYEHCGHGLCGSHLLRELTFIVDSNGYAWAANIKRMLQENCAIVASRPSKKLTEKEYQNQQKRYRNILTRGEKELPPIPPKQNGKRGKVACRLWPTRGTIRWSLSKWPSLARFTLTGVSSYKLKLF